MSGSDGSISVLEDTSDCTDLEARDFFFGLGFFKPQEGAVVWWETLDIFVLKQTSNIYRKHHTAKGIFLLWQEINNSSSVAVQGFALSVILVWS
jgi:hypothetical protein